MKKIKDFIKNNFKTNPEGHIVLDEPINFKSPISINKTPEGHIILNEPIHFKQPTDFKDNLGTFEMDKDGHYILDTPIHFKHLIPANKNG